MHWSDRTQAASAVQPMIGSHSGGRGPNGDLGQAGVLRSRWRSDGASLMGTVVPRAASDGLLCGGRLEI